MENKKIKWGILSTGWIAHKFATALQVVENCEICAVGSRNLESALSFASEFNIPKAYGSYEELVKDVDVDVIYIGTPHNLHLENTLLALDHNKNVLCEKPMGVNEREVNIMIDKAKEKNLFLMEAMWSRFLPNIIKAKDLITGGQIGEVKFLKASFCIRSSGAQQYRHFNIDLCGGTTLDIGIYNIFLSLFLLGKPEKMVAVAGLNNQGCDTNSSYVFNYGEETLAVMYSSFLADLPVVAEIHGTKGKIILEHMWFCPGNVKLISDTGVEQIFDFEIKGNGYELEAQEVVHCVLNEQKQSDKWSLEHSLELVRAMDEIRNQCGIVYPNHDL